MSLQRNSTFLESLALCIAMAYELCIGFKEDENSVFNEFNEARINLYTCLKVRS